MKYQAWRLCAATLGCMLALLGGCAPAAEGDARHRAAPIHRKLAQWPENPYTEQLPSSQAGKPDYAILDEGSGYYAIFLSDITRAEGEAYIETLVQDGFVPREGDANPAGRGILLDKGGVFVGVSVSDGVMGLYITLLA